MTRLSRFITAWWWGSLTTIGFVVVPLLFATLESPALAGQVAAKLFSAQTWMAAFCGVSLLLIERSRRHGLSNEANLPVLGGLWFALLLEFVVKPHIMSRDNLMLWHNLGTALYALQWLCVGRLLWQSPQEKATEWVAESEA